MFRASDGYRLETMPPQLLVPAATSSDGAAAASHGRAVMASPGFGGESLRRRHRDSWDFWRDGSAEPSGGPCSAFLCVDGGSEWNSKINGLEQGGFARDNWRRRLSKIIG